MKKSERLPIYVVLNDIRSLHNVGAMFRTADGVNISRLFLCGITGTPPRPEIAKTALGAENTVPFEYKKSALRTIKDLKRKYNAQVIILEKTKKSKLYTDINYRTPVVLVAGNEVTGVSAEIISIADSIIHLPMLGQKESLNVATAFGIAVYEIARKITKGFKAQKTCEQANMRHANEI